ncbi:MAG: OmpA family protein [Actinomycetota bacterium]
MSELEELPSWAGRSVSGPQQGNGGGQNAAPAEQAPRQGGAPLQTPVQPSPQPQQYQERRRRRPLPMLLFGLLGILALVGVGAIGYFLAESQNDGGSETAAEAGGDDAQDQLGSATSDEQTDADGATTGGDADAGGDAGDGTVAVETDTEAADDADGAADADATTDDDAAMTDEDATADDDAAMTDEEADAQAQVGPSVSTPPPTLDGDGPPRQAIFRGGVVYLQGFVPSEEVSQLIQDKAEAVVGPGNVVNEYQIDPSVEILPGDSAPLFVEDVVLFPFNSVEIDPAFTPILDLGTLLLRQNPQASVTVVTRTDAVGSAEVNLDVSTKRAQAVIDYWLSNGVNRDQIKADPRGEEGASESDDEQTAALNRRAEFIITGLLD